MCIGHRYGYDGEWLFGHVHWNRTLCDKAKGSTHWLAAFRCMPLIHQFRKEKEIYSYVQHVLTSESGPKNAGLFVLLNSSLSFLWKWREKKENNFTEIITIYEAMIRLIHFVWNNLWITNLHNSSDCRRRSISVSIFFFKYSSLWLIMSKHWFNVAKMVWVVARNVTDSPCWN